jgi:hypothetical protein
VESFAFLSFTTRKMQAAASADHISTSAVTMAVASLLIL